MTDENALDDFTEKLSREWGKREEAEAEFLLDYTAFVRRVLRMLNSPQLWQQMAAEATNTLALMALQEEWLRVSQFRNVALAIFAQGYIAGMEAKEDEDSTV